MFLNVLSNLLRLFFYNLPFFRIIPILNQDFPILIRLHLSFNLLPCLFIQFFLRVVPILNQDFPILIRLHLVINVLSSFFILLFYDLIFLIFKLDVLFGSLTLPRSYLSTLYFSFFRPIITAKKYLTYLERERDFDLLSSSSSENLMNPFRLC